MPRVASAAANKVHDFHTVAVAYERGRERVPFENREIVLDGHAPRVDLEPLEEVVNRQRMFELERFPVERDAHERARHELYLTHRIAGR